MSKYLLIGFLYCSFISHTLLPAGEHPLLSRITWADILGLAAIISCIPPLYRHLKHYKTIPRVYLAAMGLTGCLGVSACFSYLPLASFIEVGIVAFLVLLSLCIYFTFKNAPLQALFMPLMVGVILSTAIGLYDIVAEQYHLTRVFPPVKTLGTFVAGFKNTGQAGSFYLVVFSMLFALQCSTLKHTFSRLQQGVLQVALVSAFLGMVVLSKYAVFAGLFVGLLLLLFVIRNFKLVTTYLWTTVAVVGLLFLIHVTLPQLNNRLLTKYTKRIETVVQPAINNKSFITDNYAAAFTAFKAHPITGSGLAAFQNKYHSHEVHSTYLKLLGETGMVGVVGYLLFIIPFFKTFPISYTLKTTQAYTSYLQTLLPLLLGMFVTWTYTYHLRKREFWILVAIVMIVSYKSKNKYDVTQ